MRCSRIVEPRTVIEMGIFHAELTGALVYHRGKSLVAARQQLTQSGAGVVGAVDGGRLEQLLDGHLLTLLEPYLRAALGRG